MSDTVKVTVRISTNKVGSECKDEIEFDREEWDAMTDDQKDEVCQEVAFNYMEWGWEVNE